MRVYRDLEIHDSTASLRGDLVVLVDKEATAHVLDVRSRHIICDFSVTWDSGGRRIVVRSTNDWCASATFNRGGVQAYRLPNGEPIWRRPDILTSQRLEYDEAEGVCIVVRERGRALALNAETGATIAELKRCHGVYPSPRSDRLLLDARRLELVSKFGEAVLWSLERVSFGTLDATFTDSAVFVAESAGPLRGIDLESGQELWRKSVSGHHYMRLGFCLQRRVLFGVRWPFEKGGTSCLDAVDPTTGRTVRTHALEGWGNAGHFLYEAQVFLLYSGVAIDTWTGQQLFAVS